MVAPGNIPTILLVPGTTLFTPNSGNNIESKSTISPMVDNSASFYGKNKIIQANSILSRKNGYIYE